MCYIFFGFERGAFLRQVQYELYPQWKCKGNKNGSSVIWDFPAVWTNLKFLQKCVEKSCKNPAPFLQLSPCFLPSSSEPAAPDMFFMPVFEMHPHQKEGGSLHVQGDGTKLCVQVRNRSQVDEESPVLKENRSVFLEVLWSFGRGHGLGMCLLRIIIKWSCNVWKGLLETRGSKCLTWLLGEIWIGIAMGPAGFRM